MSLIPTSRSKGRQSNGEAAGAPPPPSPYAPKTVPPPSTEPHQLGSATLQSVDLMTSLTADEIEKVAEQVERGAQEVADTLREAARRVRHSGYVANERLANFVRVASTCADAARMMQQSVEMRDDPNANPPPMTKLAVEPPALKEHTTDLDALAEQIGKTAEDVQR